MNMHALISEVQELFAEAVMAEQDGKLEYIIPRLQKLRDLLNAKLPRSTRQGDPEQPAAEPAAEPEQQGGPEQPAAEPEQPAGPEQPAAEPEQPSEKTKTDAENRRTAGNSPW